MPGSAGDGGKESIQFSSDQREDLLEFSADPSNFVGDGDPRRIDLAATRYPQLIASAPIAIVVATGTSFALLPKSSDGNLEGYLAAGVAPLTTSCGFPSATDCVFRHSVLSTAASPSGAIIARVASILSTSPDLGSPLSIARDVLRQRDVIEIKLKDVRIALAQWTRSLELTTAGLMRTAAQLEREGPTPPPSNWHAIRATLPAGAAAVQLVPRLSWLNLGGEVLVWGATIPGLFEDGAICTRVLAESELRNWSDFLHLRDAASRLVLPRMMVGPAESRDRRLHRAIDQGHVWAANRTDAKRERAEVVKSSQRHIAIEIDHESTPGGPRRSRVRIYVTLSILMRYLGWAAILLILIAGISVLVGLIS